MTTEEKKVNWLAFMLEDNSLSMGRVMAWVTFGILVYMWLAAVTVPSTLITSFYVMLSYNFGKKLVPIPGVLGTILNNGKKVPKTIEVTQADVQVDKDVLQIPSQPLPGEHSYLDYPLGDESSYSETPPIPGAAITRRVR